ncbi:anti-sigma regulatory factor [Thermosyntropha sp.]|uniref:anti-sigma regulatory factor n=1 Tax=Thermosyntropha sp. TaxID=2740820 RepID=UPI0025DFC3E9|nr:anti-sigma regulatory factor [Thermosyntropha sp.]MBO8158545.1 anti-sigma regulatory factor [Thermosyntropha sp.]
MLISIKPEEYDFFVRINEEKDIVIARQMVKDIAKKLGFSLADITKISTVVSELARNIYRYVGEGFIYIRERKEGKDVYIELVAYDRGPGIEDIDLAITGGFTTTKGSLGLGLSGVRRLMDEFSIKSEVGKGTLVIVAKRRRSF